MANENEKVLKARLRQKHDIEANWIKAGNAETPFVPLAGEFIIYDKDDTHPKTRLKIGDGITNVNELPFSAGQEIVQETGTSETAVMSQKAVTDELSTINDALLKKPKIIDVDVLPTEGVNDTCLYRIKTFNGTFFYTFNDKLEPNDRFVLHFVDVLPIVGVVGRLYYQKSDGKHYAYSGAEGKWYEDTFPVVYSRAEVDAVDDYGAYLVENMDIKLYVPDTSNPYQIKWVALTNEADALITVDTLPESGGKDGYIYRIQKAYGAYWVIEHTGGIDDGEGMVPATLHYVDALPEVGLPFYNSKHLNIYKPKGDNGYYWYQNGEWDDVHRLFQIVESYEEIKGARFAVAFVPESTECDLYIADKSDPFNVRWVHLNKKAVSNVTTLPMDDIDEEGFYKTSENFASTYIRYEDGSIDVDSFGGVLVTFHVVDELPTQGELAVDNAESPTRVIGYYCRADKMAYVFWDIGNGEFSWIPLQEFLVFINPNATWKEIQSVDEVTDINVLYIRLNKNAIFYYDGEWHELVDKAALEGALLKKTEILDVDVLPTLPKENCPALFGKYHAMVDSVTPDGQRIDEEFIVPFEIRIVDELPENPVHVNFFFWFGPPIVFYWRTTTDTFHGYINDEWQELPKEIFTYTEDEWDYHNAPFYIIGRDENGIDKNCFYRLGAFATVYIKNSDGSISTNNYNGLPVKVYIVDELPISGESFLDDANAPTRGVAYYCKADNEVYLFAGVWAKFSDEIGAWQEVDSIDGVTTEGIAYVCLPKSKGLFHYDGEWHGLVDTIVQTTGESETAVMSQKAATDALLSLKESLEQQIAGFSLTSGEGENSIQQEGTNAISKHSVAFGSGTYAGGMGYKVTGIVLDNGIIITQETENPKKIEGTVVGYKLRTVEGLETEMNYSVRLGLAKYYCGTIASIDTTTQQILVNNAPQIKYLNTKQDDPDNDFIGNVLTITGRPELGDVNIAFNAVSFGKDNASMERNTFTAGVDNSAIGSAGTAFGNGNIAGYEAFATGRNNKALGDQSSAFGGHNEVYGAFSQVHGDSNVVYSICASAEGYANTMNAKHGHVEGCRNIVDEAAIGAHVEGSDNTTVVGRYSHIEGSYNAVLAGSESSHVEGDHNTIGSENGTNVLAAHAEGSRTVASASYAHAEGYYTESTGPCAHSEGEHAIAEGYASHAEGSYTVAEGDGSHAEGSYTKSTGQYAHSEGNNAVAEGDGSHAEGSYTKSTGQYAHSEGNNAVAEGDGSHAEGYGTKSTGFCAHSEGSQAVAEGYASHAEGYSTESTGFCAHSEGDHAVAEGMCSHAGGSYTTASGLNSFTHGNRVNATEDNSVAFGQHNIPEGRLLSVGDGTEKVPSNAFEVFADGRVGAKTPAKELTDLVQLKQAIMLSRRAIESEEIDPTVMQFKENKNNPFELSVVAASGPKTPLTELHIPAIYNNKVVTSVGEAAFKNIKDEGYPYNGLTTLTVAYGVEKIEGYAFEGCKALTYIDLPTTITEIGPMAFKQANIKTLVLPPHIKLISGQAFRGTSIENAVRIPSTCTSIGYASKEAHCGKVFGSKVPAVIFEGVPEQIHENTFLDNACDIYVPWSEGEVAGAPWGTTGKIHYNYRYATMDTVDELETRVATLENAEVEVDLTDYAKKSEVPTSMSALTNDAGYATAIDVQSMIAEAIGSAIGGSY